MRCWKCGNDKIDAGKCVKCGASQKRAEPVTDTGKALRTIYDDFGYEKVFADSRIIVSALSDLLPDSELLKHSLELVYHVDLGSTYIHQIRNSGKPDEEFYKRVNEKIIDKAGLSERTARHLITYFDEMIGWETSGERNRISDTVPSKKKTEDKPVETKAGEKLKKASVCPACGTVNKGDFVFCMSCGGPLTESADPSSDAKPEKIVKEIVKPVESTTDKKLKRNPVCPSCGTENKGEYIYCMRCGGSLLESTESSISGKVQAAAKPQTETKEKISKNPKVFIFGGIVLLLISLAVIYFAVVLSKGKETIDFKKFVNIEYSGYDADGKASLSFDYDAFNSQYEKSLTFTFEGKKNFDGLKPVQAFENILSEYITNGQTIAENLSNGDTVEYELNDGFIESFNKFFNAKIAGKKVTGVVKDLDTATVVDIFKSVELTFNGMAPFATAAINNKSTSYGLEFQIDKSKGISNGDTITISTTYGSGLKDYLLKNYGVRPASDTKKVTVSGLIQFVKDPDEISLDYMNKLQTRADTAKNAQLKESITKRDESLVSSACVGYYFIISKLDTSSETNNMLIFVYKNTVLHEFWHGGEKYSKNHVFYSACYIRNISIMPDGTYSANLANFTAHNGKTVIFNSTSENHTWEYFGFPDIDSLMNHFVIQYIDKYDYFDKIDKSKI